MKKAEIEISADKRGEGKGEAFLCKRESGSVGREEKVFKSKTCRLKKDKKLRKTRERVAISGAYGWKFTQRTKFAKSGSGRKCGWWSKSILRQRNFVSGVLVLFIAGIVAKILGAVYRIPLTWILGAEGLGMYQLVYPLFSLILVLSSTGMPTAISRVTAEFVFQGDMRAVRATLVQSLKLLTAIGAIFAVILAGSSVLISSLQGNLNLYICYLGLVPAVILVSVLSAFRGYFQGRNNMVPTATSQLVEQGGKLVFGLIMGYALLPFGVEFGTFGALIGVSISEFLAVIVMLVFYQKSRNLGKNSAQNDMHSTMRSTVHSMPICPKQPLIYKNLVQLGTLRASSSKSLKNTQYHANEVVTTKQCGATGNKESKQIRRKIIKNMIPITLSNAILPTVLFVESLFVIILLVQSGLSTTTATTFWGLNSGIVGSLINMPIALTQSVAIAIVPFVAVINDRQVLFNRYNQAMKLSLMFCVPVVIAFILLGTPILSILYQSSLTTSELALATQMLLAMSVSIVLGSLLQTQNNILQGIGFGKITARNMAISAIIQITLFLLLTKTSLNIWGCVIANIVFYATAYLLNFIFIRRKLRLRVDLKAMLPAFWGGVALSLYIININLLNLDNVPTLFFAIIGGGILYLFSVWVWGGFGKLNLRFRSKNRV